jgi:hypothetical protein
LGETVDIYSGINYRVTVGSNATERVSWTSNTCVINGVNIPSCQSCGPRVNQALQWLITAAITQIFQMTTDLQRYL